VVLAARDGESLESAEAMAALCATYWRPLYTYVRHSGRSVEDAQDLTQSFFFRLLERDSLRHVDPALGKFRSFLLVSMKNFLANEWRREQAWKRGGSAQLLSLEDLTRAEKHYAADVARPETPEQVYERNWALALLQRAVAQLEKEFKAAGKDHVFQALQPYLTGDRDGQYGPVAAELRISEVSVRVAVHRMRGRFGDLLRQEVAQTLADGDDARAIEEEMRHLLAVL